MIAVSSVSSKQLIHIITKIDFRMESGLSIRHFMLQSITLMVEILQHLQTQ